MSTGLQSAQIFGTASATAGSATVPYINVKDSPYNATGNGSTDDTSSIVAAISACDVAGGGTVIFPPGTYKVTAITINTTNAVTLFGYPGATISQFTANALSSIFTVTCSNITFDGLTFTGSITAGHEADDLIACILLTWSGATFQMTGTTIKNCSFSGKSAAIQTYMGAAAGFSFKNLTLRNNYIRCLHYGIRIGPYAQNAVVNDTILAEQNDIQITAIGGYTAFYTARPMQIINTNNLIIRNNKSIGGFSGIETYGGTGVPTRPHQLRVQILNNLTDTHIGFTQISDGVCANNVVDISLRDPSWPTMDNATIVAQYGYMPGIEADDMANCTVANNVVSNPVGAGIDFGGCDGSVLSGNSIIGSGTTAAPPYYAHGVWLNNVLTDSTIVGNTVKTCARSGIAQSDVTASNSMTNVSIVGNTIVNTQANGIHVRNMTGGAISNNSIKGANLSASTFSGIDFTDPLGGGVIRRVPCANNLLDGGKYGINQPYFEAGETKLLSFTGNVSRASTTQPFNIIGKRRNNTAATPTLTLATGHMDLRTGIDLVVLDPGIAASFTFIDNGALGDEVTIQFARADTLVTNSANLLLNGSVNVTPTINSAMTFVCVSDTTQTAQVWLEKSRMIR